MDATRDDDVIPTLDELDVDRTVDDLAACANHTDQSGQQDLSRRLRLLASHLLELIAARDESAWVVVCGRVDFAKYPLSYFTGNAIDTWSEKHERALRFSRKQDAETIVRFEEHRLRQSGHVLPAFTRVVGHSNVAAHLSGESTNG